MFLPKVIWENVIGPYLHYFEDLPNLKELIPNLNFKPKDRTYIEETYYINTKTLEYRITYIDFQIVKFESWYPTEARKRVKFYKNGIPRTEKEWYQNGKLLHFSMREGENYKEARQYHINGQPMYELISNFKNDYIILWGWYLNGTFKSFVCKKSEDYSSTFLIDSNNDSKTVYSERIGEEHKRSYYLDRIHYSTIYDLDESKILWKYLSKSDLEIQATRNQIYTLCRKNNYYTIGNYTDTSKHPFVTGIEEKYEFKEKLSLHTDLSKLKPTKILSKKTYLDGNRHGPAEFYDPDFCYGQYNTDHTDGIWFYFKGTNLELIKIYELGILKSSITGDKMNEYQNKRNKEIEENAWINNLKLLIS